MQTEIYMCITRSISYVCIVIIFNSVYINIDDLLRNDTSIYK